MLVLFGSSQKEHIHKAQPAAFFGAFHLKEKASPPPPVRGKIMYYVVWRTVSYYLSCKLSLPI